MAEYEKSTCVTFHETTEGPRLNITHRRRGCWSFIGRLNKVQDFSLGYGCRKKGTALHELGHAIGFFHEQNRPDRDRYITVHCENVEDNKILNFDLQKYINFQGEEYAFDSIMHYSNNSFSKNKQLTMTIKNREVWEEQGEPELGARKKLSDIDIRQINKTYGCYVPNSQMGSLYVKVLQAGPFQDPAHYFVCVLAQDSKNNEVSKCKKRILCLPQIQNGTRSLYFTQSTPKQNSILSTLQSKRKRTDCSIRPNNLGGVKRAFGQVLHKQSAECSLSIQNCVKNNQRWHNQRWHGQILRIGRQRTITIIIKYQTFLAMRIEFYTRLH